MRSIRIRNAARRLYGDDDAGSKVGGFTFVDFVVGAIVAGIFAAIIVFAVTSVTHHTASPTPAPKCSNAVSDEVAQIHVRLRAYKLLHHGQPPAELKDLAHGKIPAPKTSLSHQAGFAYQPDTGTYSGPCVTR